MPLYLDHHASTPCAPEVIEAMAPYWRELNSRRNTAAVEQAKAHVADLLGVAIPPGELVWTSGATEANNLAIFGTADDREYTRRVVTSPIEHKAVLEPAEVLAGHGWDHVPLSLDAYGRVRPKDLAAALHQDSWGSWGKSPGLVSVMWANNEIGTVQPIAALARVCADRGVPLHVDAAQAVGNIPTEVPSGVTMLSLCGHKFYGPRGIGALYVRQGHNIEPILYGGHQQAGLRSGTLPVPLIVGLGEAARLAKQWMKVGGPEVQRELAQLFLGELRRQLPSTIPTTLNGHSSQRLPGNINITLHGVDGARLREAVSADVVLSVGAVCSQGAPSHVLKALGLTDQDIQETIRVGIGRYNTPAEVSFAAKRIAATAVPLAIWRS